jgi:hypothetical protein
MACHDLFWPDILTNVDSTLNILKSVSDTLKHPTRPSHHEYAKANIPHIAPHDSKIRQGQKKRREVQGTTVRNPVLEFF